MTLQMWIATAAWLCMLLGFFRRKQRSQHVLLMLTAIVLDIGLVLYLQVTRNALQKAVDFELNFLQQTHVVVSTFAFVLYFPVLYLGITLWLGARKDRLRWLHIRVALTAFALRTLGFFFMFSMWR